MAAIWPSETAFAKGGSMRQTVNYDDEEGDDCDDDEDDECDDDGDEHNYGW